MGLIRRITRITLLPLVASIASAQNIASDVDAAIEIDVTTDVTTTNIDGNADTTNVPVEKEETDTGTAPNYTPQECNLWLSTIVNADADGSEGLSETEYHSFLSSINDPPYISEYFTKYQGFDNLPWVFRVVHKSLACHCEKLGRGEECCEGDNAEVLLLGLDSTSTDPAGDVAGAEEYKDLVCQQLSYVLARSISSPNPTSEPTESPTALPSGDPSSSPTKAPTTNAPSKAPTTPSPTISPVTLAPVVTLSPVEAPKPSSEPTNVPSISMKPSLGKVILKVLDAETGTGETGDDKMGVGGIIAIFIALLAIVIAILALIAYRRKQEDDRLKEFAGDQAPEADLEAPLPVADEKALGPEPETSPEPDPAAEPNDDDDSSAPSIWSEGEENEGGADELLDNDDIVGNTVGSSLAAMGAAGAAVATLNKSQ